MNLTDLFAKFDQFATNVIHWSSTPEFYSELSIITAAVLCAYTLAMFIRRKIPLLAQQPEPGPLLQFRETVYAGREMLFPILNVLFLHIAVDVSELVVQQYWLTRLAESAAAIFVLYSFANRYIQDTIISLMIKWIMIPIALLEIFGLLEGITKYLNSFGLELGNIHISAYGVLRVAIFGFFLFWLGRISNKTGQKIIRNQTNLDIGTREVFAKLFEVTLFFVISILLLQIMGINLTALAVFGGALGVGLGFGLQSIASNFISGIIILLDRSIALGDYVQTEDGLTGTVREMNLRSTVLETFDGKDIVVPNEKFITGNVINWTHKDKKQRYSLNFQVAYKTDLDLLFPLIKDLCCQHPQVLNGPDYPLEIQPDAEIQSFDDSGITILVEFWMEAIDDGRNRVGGDLLYMIWKALKENDIEIPFPQREVRILKDDE